MSTDHEMPDAPSPTTPVQPKDKSDTQWLYDSKAMTMTQFMSAYGLSPSDPAEVAAAHNLIDCFRLAEQANWEDDQLLVEQAMLWHGRLGHCPYWDLKKGVAGGDENGDARGSGKPDFKALKIELMSVCGVCVREGRDPFREG